jgi:hypothetical protein
MMKHLWQIYSDDDQSVACWVLTYFIQNKKFWDMKISGSLMSMEKNIKLLRRLNIRLVMVHLLSRGVIMGGP